MVSSLAFLYFDSEKMRFVDQRLETIASTLIASGLSLSLIENLESTNDLVHDLLGEERIDQIINIYNLKGRLLAQNYTATELPLVFNVHQRWQTVSVKDRIIRVFNFASGRIVIQIGTVLDPYPFGHLGALNKRLALFMMLILSLLISVAYLSSGILFRPLRDLTQEMRSMSDQLDRKLGQSLSGFLIGPQLLQLSQGNKRKNDDFGLLCLEITNFLKKLENYTKSFNAQAAILTHELKTPLTILKNYMSEIQLLLKSKPNESSELTQHAIKEIDHLTKVINDYLQWSVLSSNPNQPTEIHALKLHEQTKKICGELNCIYEDRISFESKGEEVTVFALPDHLHQLISNLLSNALKYSRDPVTCTVSDHQLLISDKGPGIPDSVRERMGSPFNRGPINSQSDIGSGLGLAWINALCEKYQWSLNIESSPSGTQVAVRFP